MHSRISRGPNGQFIIRIQENVLLYCCQLVITLLLALSTSVNGQTIGSPIQSPAPAPARAPAPQYTNLTELLSVAGPFHTFLEYLVSTKVIDTFQEQANNTEEGITLFVPKDSAFFKLKKPSLSNLTVDQLKSLCLFHALPHYYSLADFKNLSEISPVSTFAGGELYSLNFTYVSETVHLSSGWTNTKVSSAVLATYPVGVYQVDKILLPEAIFGTNIPPTQASAPAPAPVVDIAPDADSPDHGKNLATSSQDSSSRSSSHRMMSWGMLNHLFLAIVGGFLMLL
ncbi:fasciclin-like arabinogalactan protein 7 [Solanum dulcamara]|uniref:fasciclin-like arabinogalactan protein 7 n=1 Tax=Solanum dulcamara TaxID=45834 RepID=UPI0024857E04|nr:fasciclin-like arabinogalactan protein 7 [Solanum dulcamara]